MQFTFTLKRSYFFHGKKWSFIFYIQAENMTSSFIAKIFAFFSIYDSCDFLIENNVFLWFVLEEWFSVRKMARKVSFFRLVQKFKWYLWALVMFTRALCFWTLLLKFLNWIPKPASWNKRNMELRKMLVIENLEICYINLYQF